ncbi:MAG: hypothetical protein U0165_06465 [Polyangiaceae bacterium]
MRSSVLNPHRVGERRSIRLDNSALREPADIGQIRDAISCRLTKRILDISAEIEHFFNAHAKRICADPAPQDPCDEPVHRKEKRPDDPAAHHVTNSPSHKARWPAKLTNPTASTSE